MCACGEPVFYKKAGECKRCYHRRYNAAYHVAKVAPRARAAREAQSVARADAVALIPQAAIDAAVSDLVAALAEHKRAHQASYTIARRERERELVLLEKAAYRRRNRDAIRAADAEYRARPDVASRLRDLARVRNTTPEARERIRENSRRRRENPERRAKQLEWNRKSAAKRRARERAERGQEVRGTNLCLICKDRMLAKGLCNKHYNARWKAQNHEAVLAAKARYRARQKEKAA